jgi:hypothetical protein
MSTNNLILYRKTEALLYQVYPSLSNFPKTKKFTFYPNFEVK